MPYKYKQKITCIGCEATHYTFYPSQTKYCSQICARQFQVIPIHSEAHKRKIRESNLRTWSKPEILAKVTGKNSPLWGKKMRSGKEHPNWKGGVSKERRFNNEYAKWRRRVFDRDNYTCQVCGQYGGYLQADHVKSYAEFPELRYDISNGRALCVPCHYYVTFKRKMPKGIVWGNNSDRGIV